MYINIYIKGKTLSEKGPELRELHPKNTALFCVSFIRGRGEGSEAIHFLCNNMFEILSRKGGGVDQI